MTVPPISVLTSAPPALGGLIESDTIGIEPPVWKNASRM